MSLALDHSLVGSSEQDQRYVGLCDAEQLCYFCLGHGAAQVSNGHHLFGAQKLLVMGDASDIDGVLLVGMVIDPFEISPHVVGLSPINVVDHRQVGGIWNERHGYQPMGMDAFALSIAPQIDLNVTERMPARTQDSSTIESRFGPQSDTDSVDATNLAKVADFVEIFEAENLNWSPFFCADDIHAVGFLSGSDGVKIKDPSRASTFGGSAIMASGSITYNRSIPCQ